MIRNFNKEEVRNLTKQEYFQGVGGRAQWLRAVIALEDNLGFISWPHMAALNCL